MVSANKAFQKIIKACIYGKDITTRNSLVHRSETPLMFTFDTFPLVTLRKTQIKLALREFEWFLSGSTNVKDLHPSVQHWWKPFANSEGYIPNNYSKQFRSYGDNQFDQVDWLIKAVADHPFSRRNLITTWNTEEMQLKETTITNCHNSLFQIIGDYSDSIYKLNSVMVQRSCDVLLGLPHNWVQSYAFLQYIAHRASEISGNKFEAGQFTWMGTDVHVYASHLRTAEEIVHGIKAPSQEFKLVYKPTSYDFKADDFSLDFIASNTDKLKMEV